MTSTVLVTGGAGFIGSHLVDRLLAEDRRVIAVDDLSTGQLSNLAEARRTAPGRFEFQRLDITAGALEPLVERHRPDVICHLAARGAGRSGGDDAVRDAMVNVVGTLRVLEAARQHGVAKVVFASSGSLTYGEPDLDELPVAEGHPRRGVSASGAAKLAAEAYVESYAADHGFAWSTLALASVYGPRQTSRTEGGMVADLVDRMIAGQPVMVEGDGDSSRDLVFVDDAVHAFALALDRGDGERFNVGTGQRTTLDQLYRALAAATGYDREPVHTAEVPAAPRHLALDSRKAARELGWKPWTTHEEGLAATLAAAASMHR